MKRIVLLILCFLVVIPCFFIPAMAFSSEDLLDPTLRDDVFLFFPNDSSFSYVGSVPPPGTYFLVIRSPNEVTRCEAELNVSPSDVQPFEKSFTLCFMGDSYNCSFFVEKDSATLFCSEFFRSDCFWALVPYHSEYVSMPYTEDVGFCFDSFVAPGVYDVSFHGTQQTYSFGEFNFLYRWCMPDGYFSGFTSFAEFNHDLTFCLEDTVLGFSVFSFLGESDIFSLDTLSGSYITLIRVDNYLSPVYTGIDVFPDIFARLFHLITDNPLLSALCAASLILVCIPLFVDLKKSAR